MFFLAVVSGFLYANSLYSPFIWDDQYLILDNHFIKNPRFIFEIFKHHLYYSTAGISNFYRPLQTIFLMLDYSLYGLNPLGYHITSIIFHILTGFAIYLFISSAFKIKKLAFMVSLLFLVHPVNSTVVDYISSRADSQAAFFVLMSCYFFVKFFFAPKSRFFYAAALLSFIFALLSKELAIVAPFLVTACIPVICKSRQERKDCFIKIIPFYLILAVYILLRTTVLSFMTQEYHGPGLFLRLLTSCESFSRLILLLFLPLRIHIEKSIPISSGIFQPNTFISLLIIITIGLFICWVRNHSVNSFFGLIWFFVSLLPMSNIMPINATMADHWLYLPCAGFFLAIIGGMYDFMGRLRPETQKITEKAAISAYISIIIIFAFLTVNQNNIWKIPLKFYQKALQYSPQSHRAHNEMGVIYLGQEEYDNALAEFQMAIKNNPNFDQAYDNLGTAYDMKGDFEKAIQQHSKALELNPGNIKAYNNLGNAYQKSHQYGKAVEAYKNALKLNPGYKLVYNNLGAAYYHSGDFKNAKKYWEKALEIDPDLEMTRSNLKVLNDKITNK